MQLSKISDNQNILLITKKQGRYFITKGFFNFIIYYKIQVIRVLKLFYSRDRYFGRV